jgi:hypothetical protein
MTTRVPLPPRRHQITEHITWALEDGRPGVNLLVSAGLHPNTAQLKEVFLRPTGQVGSERDFLLDDVAVVLSRALQSGDTAKALAAGMGRKPDGSPASLVGAALDAIARIEADIQGLPPPPQPRPSALIELHQADD